MNEFQKIQMNNLGCTTALPPVKPTAVIKTISDAFAGMTELCMEFGYDYFMIGHPQLIGVQTKSSDVVLSDLPLYVVNELVELNLLADWSVAKILQFTSAPFSWNVQAGLIRADSYITSDVESGSNIGSQADEFLSQQLGIEELHCVSAATRDETRVFAALLSTQSELGELNPEILVRFQKLYDQIEAINRARAANNATSLNDREVECLSWAAAGKTSGEIAKIISLSEHTINHYLISCCKKLDCVSRTQAVAKAIRFRIIP